MALVQCPALQPGTVGKPRGKQKCCHPPTHPTPQLEVPREWNRAMQPPRVLEKHARVAAYWGKRILSSRSARLGRQSVWAGHQHGCGGFVLEPVTPEPKKDTDNHLGTHRQPSRDKYLRPEPDEFQPVAKQKHVGEPNYSGEEAQQAAPSGCLLHAEFAWLRGARPAQALVDGGYASALTVLRRRVMGGPFSTLSLHDDDRGPGGGVAAYISTAAVQVSFCL